MTETIRIASDRLSAGISPLGAELQRMVDGDGRDLLWDGDPAWWTGRAPILFPIVGRVPDDTLRVAEGEFRMEKHGFARKSRFEPVEVTPDAATFRLTDTAATRTAYPYAFTLDIAFRIDGATLTMTATVVNRDDRLLPHRLGFHPAFRWPLPYGEPRADHRLRFDMVEPAPIRRIDASGLLTEVRHSTSVDGRDLILRDDLFIDDALIFDRLESRGCTYGVPGGPGLRLGWNLPDLGVWTKPGAPYICVEPWQGFADPAGSTAPFAEGRGVVNLPPGERASYRMTVALIPEL